MLIFIVAYCRRNLFSTACFVAYHYSEPIAALIVDIGGWGSSKKTGGFSLIVLVYRKSWVTAKKRLVLEAENRFFHQNVFGRGNDRTCLSRCALSQYWYSFSWPSWKQKYPFGPCLHYRSLKKVWNCLFLLYLWCQQEPCRITCFCRLLDLLYFLKKSWWTRFTCSDRLYHDE